MNATDLIRKAKAACKRKWTAKEIRELNDILVKERETLFRDLLATLIARQILEEMLGDK